MLCRADTPSFYNGVLVGPGTGNEDFNYTGNEKDLPPHFTLVSEEVLVAEAVMRVKQAAEDAESSKGLLLHEVMNPTGVLEVSGGGKSNAELAALTLGGAEAIAAAEAEADLEPTDDMDGKGTIPVGAVNVETDKPADETEEDKDGGLKNVKDTKLES